MLTYTYLLYKEDISMTLRLKDCLPDRIPISKELLEKYKPDSVGARRMLVDYQDMILFLLLNSDCSVEILFIYSPLEKYDESFYRAEDELLGTFHSCGEGGYITIESQNGGG